MKKALLLPAIALTMAGTVLFATQSFAQESTDSQQSLVQKISEKFNLNKDEVQAVFTEHRTEHHAQMQEKFEDRLSQLVKDGKLTEEQKAKILAKFAEVQANREGTKEKLQSMTPEERKTAMKAHHDELTTWAKENGIDLESLGLFVVNNVKGEMKGHPEKGMMLESHLIMEK